MSGIKPFEIINVDILKSSRGCHLQNTFTYSSEKRSCAVFIYISADSSMQGGGGFPKRANGRSHLLPNHVCMKPFFEVSHVATGRPFFCHYIIVGGLICV